MKNNPDLILKISCRSFAAKSYKIIVPLFLRQVFIFIPLLCFQLVFDFSWLLGREKRQKL